MNAPAVTCLGPVSAATIPWRARGALYLTVVVKATFALAPEGRMRSSALASMASAEQLAPSGVGLVGACDLVPYLGQPEVWLIGHAAIPPRGAPPSVHVQLAVVQEGVVRLDRQLELDCADATGNPPFVRIGGMGPIAADWPLRERWLEGIDRRCLQGPILDLPDALHWQYFQSSPLDQRLESLRGDEWLVLGGMIPGRPRLRSQLPAASAVARLYRETQAAPRTGEPVALHVDTLQIDVDRRTCTLLWRGRVKLVDEGELASLCVVAGLEQAGQPVAWVDPFPGEEILFGTIGLTAAQAAQIAQAAPLPFAQGQPALAPPARATTSAPAAEALFTGTAAMPVDFAQKLAAALATPFEQPSAPAADALLGTMMIPDDVGRMLAAAPSTPFDPNRREVAARRDPPAAMRSSRAPLPAPEPRRDESNADWMSSTTGMPVGLSALLAVAPATPFEPRKAVTEAPPDPPAERIRPPVAAHAPAPHAARSTPIAPAADPLLGTMMIPDDVGRMLAAAPSTPFDPKRSEGAARREPPATAHVSPAPQPSPEPRRDAGDGDWMNSTTGMPVELSALLAVAPATPFEARRADTAEPSAPPPERISPLVAAPAPSRPITRSAPIIDLDDESFQLQDLGAQFLAGMAAVEARAE